MARIGYSEEHEAFRHTVRSFLDREHEPYLRQYEAKGGLDRDFWKKAGAAGLLGLAHTGEGDFTYYAIMAEELGRTAGSATTGSSLMADVATYILIGHGTQAQKDRYLPGVLTGEWTQAMPLTEPGVGSDATAIAATATRDGDDYVINGEKYFISNGAGANLLYVVAKTDPAKGGRGMSVIIVESDTPGVAQSKIPMIGWRQGDTGALNFDNVRVPATNLVGVEGGAMKILMDTFLEDRIQIAARCLGAASKALELTLDYVKQRKVFDQRVIDFQNSQFMLADCRADIRITETMVDTAMIRLRNKEFTFEDGAILKLWATQMEGRVLDRCVQLFGGAGLMDENPIARMWTVARIQRIYAGTDELQKVAIARGMLA